MVSETSSKTTRDQSLKTDVNSKPAKLTQSVPKIGIDKLLVEKKGPVTLKDKNERIIRKNKHILRKCANVKTIFTCEEIGIDYSEQVILDSMKSGDAFDVIKYVDIKVKQGMISSLLDCGSSITIFSEDIVRNNFPDVTIKQTKVKLKAFSGTMCKPIGEAFLPFNIGNTDIAINAVIVPVDIHQGIILGIDFLTKFKCSIDFGQGILHSPTWLQQVNLHGINTLFSVRYLKAYDNYVIPSKSVMEIKAKFSLKNDHEGINDPLPDNTLGKLEKLPLRHINRSKHKEFLYNLPETFVYTKGEYLVMKVQNDLEHDVTINQFCNLGLFRPVQSPNLFANTIITTPEYEYVKRDFKLITDNPYNYEKILSEETRDIDERFRVDFDECIFSSEHKKILKYIISENRDAFIVDTEKEKLGKFKGLEYEIPIQKQAPFWKCKAYSIAEKDKEAYQKIIAEHISLGLITPATHGEVYPRVSPFILIKKGTYC